MNELRAPLGLKAPPRELRVPAVLGLARPTPVNQASRLLQPSATSVAGTMSGRGAPPPPHALRVSEHSTMGGVGPRLRSEELLMRKQSALFAFAALALCYGAASAQEQMPVQHDASDAPASSQATSPERIASSDAARGQNPRTGNDRCAGRRNDGAGAEVRGSMVRPVRAQAAVRDTDSCAIDWRNAGEAVGGGKGERPRPAGLARRSIERSSVCAPRRRLSCSASILRGNNRFPRDSRRHEGAHGWRRSGPNQHSETAVDAGRAFSIVALGKRAPMPYVWLPRRAISTHRNGRSGRPALPRKNGGSA